jgi:2,3-bisphosphoglycerate-independent phosphoglycerate mutase
MLNEEGTPKTSHTTNLVPFVMANAPETWTLKKEIFASLLSFSSIIL